MTNKQLAAVEQVAGHVMATLPDSLSRRRAILESLCLVCQPCRKTQKQAEELLYHLDRHEIAQREFAFHFSNPSTPAA